MLNDIDTEIMKEYARLVAVLASFEDEGLSEFEQLNLIRGLVGIQYAHLADLVDDQYHEDFLHMVYEKAGFHSGHKFAHLFGN